MYVVLFADAGWQQEYNPIVTSFDPQGAGSYPHQLDHLVAAALPALHYSLRLPKTLWELRDIPTPYLQIGHSLATPHDIQLMPVEAFLKYFRIDHDSCVPMLVISPDEHYDQVTSAATNHSFILNTVRISDLCADLLETHWATMQSHFLSAADEHLDAKHPLDAPTKWTPALLPFQRLSHQMNIGPAEGEDESILRRAFMLQKWVSIIAGLEREGAQWDEAKIIAERRMAEMPFWPRLPLTLAIPGVAAAYTRGIRSAAEEADASPYDPDDEAIELSAFSLIATHRSMAQDSVGLVAPELPAEIYVHLAELEKHWSQGPTAKGVKSLLRKINNAAKSFWTDDIVKGLQRASSLSVISNFPLGIMTLPGDSSPLMTRLPISYSPLMPLTRSIQSELAAGRGANLTAGFHVLVVECISDTDPVGIESRKGWEFAAEVFKNEKHEARLSRIEVNSPEELQQAIDDSNADVLVLSAHGFNSGSMAGIMVGGKPFMGTDLENLPPVVILSACHVSPRGRGQVSVADLLLRQGAVAVLGTQVPVDVRNNALLMVRFFVYMIEVLVGRGTHANLLSVWHHVQSLNAVNDVVSGSRQLQSWMLSQHLGRGSVLTEFMSHNSKGRLRSGRLYEDTEQVLLEMAQEQGMADKVRGWLNTPGYIPESLFYIFIGRPENILLRPIAAISDLGVTSQ